KSITTHEYMQGVRRSEWPPFDRRLWQRNYFEHVIRSDGELSELRRYVEENPLRWALDEENPADPGGGRTRR
ncbi:MAG TPA: hypothetical protein VEW03_00055, partial [Longimicrobiaceae bacterium]|nr:hypothetical protein [Longimicrobiaceae bacterium]